MRKLLPYLPQLGLVILVACATDMTATQNGSADLEGEDHEDETEVPNDWFVSQRAYPHAAIDPVRRLAAFQAAQRFADEGDGAASGTWSFVGPDNVGGRITDIQSSPARPSTVYAASAAGGVFRSDDGGSSFRPVFDGQASLSIGTLAVDPRNADVVWVGTGEANSSGDSYPGTGVYLSTDGGTTWRHVGLERSEHVGRIVVDPTNSSVVYVAAMGSMRVEDENRGLYRTTDSGATWQKILYTSTRVGAIDVAVDPQNPQNLYAGLWERMRDDAEFKKGGPGSGLFRSTDGGATWARATQGLPTPSDTSGRVGLTLCAGSPRTLYSIFDDTSANFSGVYRSDDAGVTWRRTGDGGIASIFSSYGWWFGNIRVNPTNPEQVFALGLYLARSDDGGASWAKAGGRMHSDHHALFIDPTNPQRLYEGNDGGFHVSTDGSHTWVGPTKMPVTQFYNIAVDPLDSKKIYGGAQDNGTVHTTTGGISDWRPIYGGDGFQVIVDPVDTNTVYAESQNGAVGRSTDGGRTFSDIAPQATRSNWNTPIRLDPNDHQTIYFGGDQLFRSPDQGATWSAISPDLTNGPVATRPGFGTITTFSVAPTDSKTIYVGTDDANVWVTRDTGAHWTKITQGLPNLWVTSVHADSDNAAAVWVTFSGYDDAPNGRVFYSDTAGASWRPIAASLPPVPVNALARSPRGASILYVGTDTGVFSTSDAGATWRPLGTGLPLAPVLDLVLDRTAGRVLAATHGRSIYALSTTP
jgi:photosystem II stability/assembly factor-like uncharacterized protein